ncbi:unnamed protein product [Protopolystoma xenopodis]|uniref:Uncharacterized protein n=1 Tax=Protopolystoma xenopodis TaxID=117903 RepID=A0A3S5BBI3_9PLAT|nr:unnamed protein product [Protopolystoma xenopodis]
MNPRRLLVELTFESLHPTLPLKMDVSSIIVKQETPRNPTFLQSSKEEGFLEPWSPIIRGRVGVTNLPPPLGEGPAPLVACVPRALGALSICQALRPPAPLPSARHDQPPTDRRTVWPNGTTKTGRGDWRTRRGRGQTTVSGRACTSNEPDAGLVYGSHTKMSEVRQLLWTQPLTLDGSEKTPTAQIVFRHGDPKKFVILQSASQTLIHYLPTTPTLGRHHTFNTIPPLSPRKCVRMRICAYSYSYVVFARPSNFALAHTARLVYNGDMF